ncbi:pyridoxal phosphate-dependent decarboxylase family protein [Benzoatithermus flavus]|uniref:Pyridoxal-dependent decarboxylase n=1 Tax=Benzoatithermus flavus TaxID=3108223 RepID=A0ABU8XWD6_9PROT
MSSDDRPDGTLDPEDWEAFRAICHRAVDRMIERWAHARERPVWQSVPDAVKDALAGEGPPERGIGLEATLRRFEELILPYPTGNTHPRFLGWVHGSGTPVGALAEFLAGAMNANLGGREHAPVHVERQVIRWSRTLFGLPEGASGLLVGGTSTATLIGLACAREAKCPGDVRREGLQGGPARLTGYTSREAHGSVTKAFELLGLGREHLRLVPVDAELRMDVRALQEAVAADRAAGFHPFCVVATAGTVNTGAIDDLAAIGHFCREQSLWLHVDAAFGGLAVLVPELAPRLAGIEQADSLAFDFHKWLHVPYDAGCVLIRDEGIHRATFALRPDYLAAAERGLAGGNPWFCEYGIDLSRGFRALKVWFTLLAYGLDRLGEAIARNCADAAWLGERVAETPELELLAPVALNIVCFRWRDGRLSPAALDALNAAVVADLHEEGIAAPSTTQLDGRLAIRACLCNHRTDRSDLAALLEGVITLARRRAATL